MKKICLIFIVLIQTFQAQINLNSSLTACYALNGNAYEAINALHGTISNASPAPNRFNSANSAYSFNGNANTFIELPSNTLIKPNAFTFSAWIKPNLGFNAKSYVLFTRNSAANTNSMAAYALSLEDLPSGKRFRVTKGNPSNSVSVDNTSLISLNAWYHVCFTMDTVIKIYLNGVLESTVIANIPYDYAFGKRVYLGASNEPNDNHPFMGSIDNARFYNRILSASEVNQLYLNDPACSTTTAAPVASITVTSPSCAYQPITFFDNSSNFPTSWYWQINGPINYASMAFNPTFTFSPGTYTTTLVCANAFGSSTVTIPFVVNPLPTVTTAGSPTVIGKNNGTPVTLWAYGAQSYTWSTGQTNSLITIYTNVSTTYTVIGRDSLGCENTSSISVKVYPVHGIQENNEASIKVLVYPNPVESVFTLEVLEQSVKDFSVYNVSGQLIKSGKIDQKDKVKIDLSDQANGIYFLKLSSDIGTRTIRLIKE